MAKPIMSDQDYGGIARILGLLPGVLDNEPATMAQLKAAIEGLNWKDSVRVRAPGSVNLASPGTAIDGVTLVANDRFLAPLQSTATENGIYVFNGPTTPATRALDANTSDELEQAIVTVEEGTTAGTTYRQTLVNFALGTGTPTFVNFGTVAAPATEGSQGIAAIATQAEVDAGTNDTKFVTPLKLSNYSKRVKTYTGTIGDGSATQYDLTHNLGTRAVQVEVYYNSGNYDTIQCDVQRPNVNTVRLKFAAAVPANSLSAAIAQMV